MSPSKYRVVIVAAEFNKELVDAMVESAVDELTASGGELRKAVRVSGAYEIPLVTDLYLAQPAVDAVVALGYIERGETLHGEVMGHVVHAALVRLQLEHHKPVGIGIIGPGATSEQAEKRKDLTARAAVKAALRSCQLVAEAPGNS